MLILYVHKQNTLYTQLLITIWNPCYCYKTWC